jgi:hypothetical protein
MGQRGGHGLLFDGELIRAVRTESALAIGHWWGVSEGVVWRSRKVLGIPRAVTEGSKLLIQAAAQAGADVMQAREFNQEEREVKRRNARRLNLGQHLKTGYHGPHWTEAELQLLGRLPDADVAAIAGRTVTAVRIRRTKLGIPTARDGRKRRAWTTAERHDIAHEWIGKALPTCIPNIAGPGESKYPAVYECAGSFLRAFLSEAKE